MDGAQKDQAKGTPGKGKRGTPGKRKGAIVGSPKAGDKRKLDGMPAGAKAVNINPDTPAQGQTPVRAFTLMPQKKTPVSPGKGGKKQTPVPEDSDDEEEEEVEKQTPVPEDSDDEEEEEEVGYLDTDSDDSRDGGDVVVIQMDDGDYIHDSKGTLPDIVPSIVGDQGDCESEDDDDDDSEGDDEEDDETIVEEDDILTKIRELRAASKTKGQRKQKQNGSNASTQSQSPAKPEPQHKQSPTKQKEEESEELSKTEAIDKCTLFLKNLPPTIEVSEIKALSEDIKEVRLRITVRTKRRIKKKMGFAYLEFASEAVADKNYESLQGAKFKDHELIVDYVGEKSNYSTNKPKKRHVDLDPTRLYITGFGGDVKDADLHKLFPKAKDIVLPRQKNDQAPIGYAFAAFDTEQQCKTAYEKCQGAKLHGHNLVVLYAKRTPLQKDSDNEGSPPAKKVKEEDSESDDVEDDSDEDEASSDAARHSSNDDGPGFSSCGKSVSSNPNARSSGKPVTSNARSSGKSVSSNTRIRSSGKPASTCYSTNTRAKSCFRDCPPLCSTSHGIPFPSPDSRQHFFSRSLKRFEGACSFEDLLRIARDVNAAAKAWPVGVLSNLWADNYSPDPCAVDLYPQDGPDLQPVWVHGDGNCLARCASLLACGVDEGANDLSVEMRARIVTEMAVFEQHYLALDQSRMYAQYSEHFEFAAGPTYEWVRDVYHQEVGAAAMAGTDMGMWAMHAVSSILGTPLFSVYPEYAGYNVRRHLNTIVHPRTTSESSPLREGTPVYGIMWTNTNGKSLAEILWRPNHFVVCLPLKKDSSKKKAAPGKKWWRNKKAAKKTLVTKLRKLRHPMTGLKH